MGYDFKWALGIVNAFVEGRPRVAKLAMQALGINEQTLARFVASRDTRWEIFKKVVKLCEKWIETAYRHGNMYVSVEQIQLNAQQYYNWKVQCSLSQELQW